ncbi:MAG: phage head closure protein [Methylocystis sp.]|nr:phage head closure protein [Methylocystis sp.]
MSALPAVGELRVRAIIEAPVDTPDDSGAMTRTYAPLANVWAHVTALTGEAHFVAARQEQSLTHLVRMRWRADVTSEMRLVVGSRKLLIHSVYDPDERRRLLMCRCEEIKS